MIYYHDRRATTNSRHTHYYFPTFLGPLAASRPILGLPLHQRRRRRHHSSPSPRYFPPAASPPSPSSSLPQLSIAALLPSGCLSTSAAVVVVSTVLHRRTTFLRLPLHQRHRRQHISPTIPPLPSPSSSPRFTNAMR